MEHRNRTQARPFLAFLLAVILIGAAIGIAEWALQSEPLSIAHLTAV